MRNLTPEQIKKKKWIARKFFHVFLNQKICTEVGRNPYQTEKAF